MVNDRIADMLTRIRNGLKARKPQVEVLGSNINLGIAQVLKTEGYIQDFKAFEVGPRKMMLVYLKYGPDGEMVITEIKRESKPGRRLYRDVSAVPRVRDGMGIAIFSTSKGILSDRECRRQRVGGELLCTVA
jgi:small subunit ribosomal protein S8